jgi:drug/metabolite transporter (DMT)-like permease
MHQKNRLADLALLGGAFVWGVVWYPYRALDAAGIGGATSSFLTYFLALLPGLWLFRGECAGLLRAPWLLGAIALAAGWCNLAYVLAMLRGDVMQVMLLFYLAPLWTVLLSRLLLHERSGGLGYLVVALSLAGAVIMLWEPGRRFPVPDTSAEWLALSSGMAFALANVLSRRAKSVDVRVRSLSVWAGVSLAALPVMFWVERPLQALGGLDQTGWALILLVAVVIFAVNVSVQHGLAHTAANRAIVIFLTELVFAAGAAYVLAAESMGWQQWVGGTMIVAATLFSGRLEVEAPEPLPARA